MTESAATNILYKSIERYENELPFDTSQSNFVGIHEEITKLVEENNRLKEQQSNFLTSLNKVLDNIELYKSQIKDSQDSIEEDNRILNQAFREIEEREQILENYSLEIAEIQEMNKRELHRIEKL